MTNDASQAEQALLGAVLLDNAAYDLAADRVAADDFGEPVHGRIWAAIAALAARGERATPVTLLPFFEGDEALADVGGAGYLGRLVAAAVGVASAADYARAVRDAAVRRRLAAVGEAIVERARRPDPDETAAAQVEAAEAALYDLAERREGGGPRPLDEALGPAADRAGAGGARGLGTGFRDLDRLTGGLRPGQLAVLAGRPSMGKSALAGQIAAHVAGLGVTVLLFSLEMSADELAERHLARVADLNLHALRTGRLDAAGRAAARSAAERGTGGRFHVDDQAGLGVAAMRTRARRVRRRAGLGLVVVDYLQLVGVSAEVRRKASTVAEVSEASSGLKALAKDLGVPVLAVSQLSRAVEARDDKRPQLADLRESGAIEQDADLVMFVYRESYYLARRKPAASKPAALADWEAEMAAAKGKAEVILAKSRNGPVGTVALRFDAGRARFQDLERAEGAA